MKPLIRVRRVSLNTKNWQLFGTADGGQSPQTRECYGPDGFFIKNVTKPRIELPSTTITCYDADGRQFQ